jgi:hypothetical protein
MSPLSSSSFNATRTTSFSTTAPHHCCYVTIIISLPP